MNNGNGNGNGKIDRPPTLRVYCRRQATSIVGSSVGWGFLFAILYAP